MSEHGRHQQQNKKSAGTLADDPWSLQLQLQLHCGELLLAECLPEFSSRMLQQRRSGSGGSGRINSIDAIKVKVKLRIHFQVEKALLILPPPPPPSFLSSSSAATFWTQKEGMYRLGRCTNARLSSADYDNRLTANLFEQSALLFFSSPSQKAATLRLLCLCKKGNLNMRSDKKTGKKQELARPCCCCFGTLCSSSSQKMTQSTAFSLPFSDFPFFLSKGRVQKAARPFGMGREREREKERALDSALKKVAGIRIVELYSCCCCCWALSDACNRSFR